MNNPHRERGKELNRQVRKKYKGKKMCLKSAQRNWSNKWKIKVTELIKNVKALMSASVGEGMWKWTVILLVEIYTHNLSEEKPAIHSQTLNTHCLWSSHSASQTHRGMGPRLSIAGLPIIAGNRKQSKCPSRKVKYNMVHPHNKTSYEC